MNSELKNRVFELPQEIIDFVTETLTSLNGEQVYGIERASNLILKKEVSYGQLKSIIHDFKTIDKEKEPIKYNLMGGILMDRWAKKFLDSERERIKKRKEGRRRANEIGGMDGTRKNGYISKHKKNTDLNLVSGSIVSKHKSVLQSLTPSLKLFEEINRIKQLM